MSGTAITPDRETNGMDQERLDIISKAARIPLDVIDLGEWIDACKRQSVPHITAEKLGSCWAQELICAAYGEVESAPIRNLDALMRDTVQHLDLSEHMLRWSCCSTFDLKAAMDKDGRAGPESRGAMNVDDPRFIGMLESDWQWMKPVTLYRRTWVEAMYHGSHPVEFRVFVENGDVVGVSNYYSQRGLPEEYGKLAKRCKGMTQPLCNEASDFTADWLVTPDCEVLFLEGGPPHRNAPPAAHPCCFAPNNTNGIALQKQEGCVV